jgi:hypothetical protein
MKDIKWNKTKYNKSSDINTRTFINKMKGIMWYIMESQFNNGK